MIDVNFPDGTISKLTAGGQNVLMKEIVEQFCPRYTPGADIVYMGDAGEKISESERAFFSRLSIDLDYHGKMPDVIAFLPDRNWLVLIEAVTSHGPIDNKRKRELETLFGNGEPGLVYITAFPDRKTMMKYIDDIAWETDVWLSQNPTHLIHFNGERFLGPYEQ